MTYHHVFVAGTFEGLHKGHRVLLERAFAVGTKVTIGVTSDGFVARYKSKIQNPIRSFSKRKRNIEEWLRSYPYTGRATIIHIDDPYEPAASMGRLDALVVTKETRARGEEINRKRTSRGLPRLALVEVPMVSSQDGNPISATRVRKGEIDRDGRLVMPESMRLLLGKPLGSVLSGKTIDGSIRRNKDKLIITVGDVATKTLLDQQVTPALAIIDGKVGRKPYPDVVSQLRKGWSCEAKSGPGYISREAVKAIRERLSCHVSRVTCHAILIDGEEDLLVLPALIHAPLKSVVYYGQPHEGLVEVVVTEEKKQEVSVLLQQFT